jgi:alpha-beta hydrolase superfamily lysophospholipase
MLSRSAGWLTGVGGGRLYHQAWGLEGARGVVVLAHGLSEHSGRYEHVAERLVGEGFAVEAVDHRGHGRSEGARALVEVDDLVEDLDRLVDAAVGAHPGVPLFLLGHSMGGLIAAEYAMGHQHRLAGLVLSAPLAALEAASPVTRLTARVISAVAPRLGLVEIDSALVSRNPEVVRAYDFDPLVYRGRLPARTVSELASAIGSLPERATAITLPVLIMYGSGDHLVPPAGSVMLDSVISSKDKTLKVYDGLFHEILNEPEQETVLDDLCAWLLAHVEAAA